MNRCTKSRVGIALVLSAALAGVFPSLTPLAIAQGFVREAPKDVKRGRLTITATPPMVLLNGVPDRLSPGSRIRNLNNMLVLSGSIAGQTFPVVYRRDSAGLIHEAWMLTAEEDAKLAGVDSPDGYLRFAELLAIIFGARR